MILEFIDKEEWQRLVPQFLDYNYRQSWNYSSALGSRWRAKSEHIAIYEDNNFIALAEIRIKKIPFFDAGVAYISGGPLVRRGRSDDITNLRRSLEVLINEYVKKRGLVIRILSPLHSKEWNQQATDIFKSLGFSIRNDLPGHRTLVMDLKPTLEEIRANLAQKWRNCLNASHRNELHIRTATGPTIYKEFCDLYEPFLQRKGLDFELDAHFYADFQDKAPESDRLIVSIAEKDGKIIAGHVASMLGDTCIYLHGATNEDGLKAKAGYAVQWHVISEAKNRGFRYYDLGGIDPVNNPGVYHFKTNMGGYEVSDIGPFEIRSAGIKGFIFLTFEMFYRKLHYTLRRIRAIIRLSGVKH